jgi:hypothetical protein
MDIARCRAARGKSWRAKKRRLTLQADELCSFVANPSRVRNTSLYTVYSAAGFVLYKRKTSSDERIRQTTEPSHASRT